MLRLFFILSYVNIHPFLCEHSSFSGEMKNELMGFPKQVQIIDICLKKNENEKIE